MTTQPRQSPPRSREQLAFQKTPRWWWFSTIPGKRDLVNFNPMMKRRKQATIQRSPFTQPFFVRVARPSRVLVSVGRVWCRGGRAGRKFRGARSYFTLPAPATANRKDSADRIFHPVLVLLLLHVHNVHRRRRHDVGDAVKNRLPNLRR